MTHPTWNGISLPASSLIVAPRPSWPQVAAEVRGAVHMADFWQSADPEKPVTMTDVRSLRAFAERTPMGPYKVAVCQDASAFRMDTANALLKLLEEPPPYLFMVLVSESPHVLPTIRSRVRVIEAASDSAILDQEARQGEGLWHQLAEAYPPADAAGRSKLQALAYLQPLIHTTIKPETILQPYIRSQS